ncbi:DUF6262 family protein [Streptomyces sp. NBC_01462]|uniref:DUF6262 family protein n=1 Tax=Streptomyces sp. NBC_01462 TaxID=2903876 RepID=UPI002E339132|nr:DUF6262 family protein [Streptomyces sp. NBC_01462]
MTAARTPAQVLLESRQRDSQEKRARVISTVNAMKAKGETITFLGVARAARVSNWLVYSVGIREFVEEARRGQAGTKAREKTSGSNVSAASLATDLELARAELAAVRDERAQLKEAVQRHLGHQLHQTGAKELSARVDELQAANKELEQRLRASAADRQGLQDALQEAQDDLIAAREAMRNMMREQNRPT